MTSIEQLKQQVVNANTLGRTNLAEKGVELPETATTYEIMQGIENVSGGGTESYADDFCEYYGIDKTTYPYISVVVLDTGKTKLMCSAEPLLPGKEVPYVYYEVGKTTGLVDETRSSVVFGWFKGFASNGISSWRDGVTTVYVMRGTWFTNYPIEETDKIKCYPL